MFYKFIKKHKIRQNLRGSPVFSVYPTTAQVIQQSRCRVPTLPVLGFHLSISVMEGRLYIKCIYTFCTCFKWFLYKSKSLSSTYCLCIIFGLTLIATISLLKKERWGMSLSQVELFYKLLYSQCSESNGSIGPDRCALISHHPCSSTFFHPPQ